MSGSVREDGRRGGNAFNFFFFEAAVKTRVGKKYVIYLCLILAGVSLSGRLLTGPLKHATDGFMAPAIEKNVEAKSGGEDHSQLEKLYVIVFLILTIYGAHLAARFLSDRAWRRRDHYARDVRWSVLDFVAMVFLYFALAGIYTTFFAHPSDSSGAFGERAVLEIIVSAFSYVIVLLFGIWILKLKGSNFADGMGLSIRPYGRLILIGVAAFLAFQPLNFIYTTAMAAAFYGLRLPIEGHPVVKELLRPDEIGTKASLAISVALFAPFFEEIFFRGFLYQALRRNFRAPAAIVITAGLFASIHPRVFQTTLIFPLGLLLAYLMEKTGSVIPCIVVHFLVNGTSLLLTFLLAS